MGHLGICLGATGNHLSLACSEQIRAAEPGAFGSGLCIHSFWCDVSGTGYLRQSQTSGLESHATHESTTRTHTRLLAAALKQHGIAIRIEAISSSDRLLIAGQDSFAAAESTHQH